MFCKTMQSKNAAASQNRELRKNHSDISFSSSDSYRNPRNSVSSGIFIVIIIMIKTHSLRFRTRN